jgi:hypothetical protein
VNVREPPAVVGEEAETVPDVVWLVSHLSVVPDPPSGFVTLQVLALSSQYVTRLVVSVGVYDAPNCVEVRVGAVGEPPPEAA